MKKTKTAPTLVREYRVALPKPFGFGWRAVILQDGREEDVPRSEYFRRVKAAAPENVFFADPAVVVGSFISTRTSDGYSATAEVVGVRKNSLQIRFLHNGEESKTDCVFYLYSRPEIARAQHEWNTCSDILEVRKEFAAAVSERQAAPNWSDTPEPETTKTLRDLWEKLRKETGDKHGLKTFSEYDEAFGTDI